MIRHTATWLVALLTLVSFAQSPAFATNWTKMHAATGKRIELPIQAGVPVSDGYRLVAVHYTVSSNGDVFVYHTLETQRGLLGVSSVMIDEKSVRDGERPYEGVRVKSVAPNTPAARIGIVPGDTILSADGVSLSNPQKLRFIVRHHDLSRPLKVAVRRGGTDLTFEVELETKAHQTTDLSTFKIPTIKDPHSGILLGEVEGEVRRHLFGEGQAGVLVMKITGGSPAFYTRLRSGDILTHVGGQPVSAASQVTEALGSAAEGGKDVSFAARRGDRQISDELEPVESLPSGFSFYVPFVVDIDKTMPSTDVDLLPFGILFNYERDSYVLSDGHRERSEWGMLLNLIAYEKRATKKSFRLLWFIKWSW